MAGYWPRLIQGHEQPCGLGFILGLKAGEGFVGVIKSVENAFATEE
jgi:hypothetical protein